MAAKPSILILNRVFPPQFGATGRMACDLALYLRKQGYVITVVTTAEQPTVDTARSLKVVRVLGEKHPEGGWAYYRILKRMKKAAMKLPRHDIVISLTDPPLLAHIGHQVAKKMRAKHIHWAHDLYPDLLPVMGVRYPQFVYRHIEKRMRKAMKAATAIVAISKCMASYMTYQSIDRRRLHTIENWPEGTLLKEDDNTQAMDLFKGEEKFRILYSGTIGLAHDFDAVLKAANYLQKNNPEIEFVFVGRGRGVEELSRKKQQAGLDNMRFLPPQPAKNLKAMMEAGDVHLVTMKKNALGKLFPCKFYAACAASRPVIFVGPKGCDIDTKIKMSGCGASVRNEDAKALTQAILAYRYDGNAWYRAGAAAGRLVAENGGAQKSLKAWEDLIESLG